MAKVGDITQWLEKAKKVGKGEADLSRDEDLAIGIMNLVSLEEHFYFTAMKTNDGKYLDMLQAVRSLRQKMMKKIVVDPQGEEWCISKHLLAASMRLIEVGTKEQTRHPKEAQAYFEAAFELFSLFFATNLKMVDRQKIGAVAEKDESKVMSKFSGIMKRILDCCKEW